MLSFSYQYFRYISKQSIPLRKYPTVLIGKFDMKSTAYNCLSILFCFFLIGVTDSVAQDETSVAQDETQSVSQVNERLSKSQISTNVYFCVDVFGDFSANCAFDYWVLEFRWRSRENAPPINSRYKQSTFRSFSRRFVPADNAGSGIIEGGIALGVDTENSTPPPRPIPTIANLDKDFRPVISGLEQAPDSSEYVQHNGFYFAQLQAVFSLPSPLTPELFSINVFGGAGFSWLRGKGPEPGVAGVEGKKGIPVLSYGAEFVTYANRFTFRLQLNNTVFYTNNLDYIYLTDQGVEEMITQDVKSIRKLNLLIGVGFVIVP